MMCGWVMSEVTSTLEDIRNWTPGIQSFGIGGKIEVDLISPLISVKTLLCCLQLG